MLKEKLLFRKIFLLGLNLFLFLLVFFNASVILSPIESQSLPDESLAYDFRTEKVKINKVTPSDLSVTDSFEGMRAKVLASSEKPMLDFTLSGKVNFYLIKEQDEVLSRARLEVSLPLLNLQEALLEFNPGQYSGNFQQTWTVSLDQPAKEIDPDIGTWRIIPLGLRVNSRLQEAFSYADYLSGQNYQNNSSTITNKIPIEINISFQILDKKGIPLANQSISGEFKSLTDTQPKEVILTSDSQGIISYTLKDELTVTYSGGQLLPLNKGFILPDPVYKTTLIDQYNRSYTVWSPALGEDKDNLRILSAYWGQNPPAERPEPSQRGRTDTRKQEGQSPHNPPAGVDPINMINGNVYTWATDVVIPSKGMPLKFERYYNSFEDYNGVLGFGWTHSYNLNIILDDTTNTAILMLGDGRRIYFSRDASGNFTPPKAEYSTLVKNSDNSFTWTTKTGEVYTFNSEGKFTSIKDRNNNQTTLTYDSGGNLIKITSAGSRKIELSYNSDKRITSIALPNGSYIRYEYDNDSNLKSVTDALGNVTKYRYAPYHLLEQITDPENRNRYFGYDYNSRGISFYYDYNNYKISVSYDEANKKTWVTDSRGNKTDYYYADIEGAALINKVVDVNAKSEEYTWDTDLNRTQVKDKNGNSTKMTYDTKGNLLTITDPQGNVTTFTYEPKYNLVTSTKDALGNTTTYAYDANGNLVTLTDALGNKTEFTYDASGQLSKTKNPRGYETKFTYNAFGDLETTADALGNVTTFTYDLMGNCYNLKDPKANTTIFDYDVNSQLLKTTYADATYTSFTYDKAGNRITVKDYLGNVTQYAYDSADKITRVSDALGNATTYTYDNEGNLICLTDAAGNQTLYEYDALNRLTKTANPLGIANEYEYDNIGNRTRLKDGRGNLIAYTYDTLNRLTKITYPDAKTVEFSYDKLSRRATMKDKLGTTTYTYDALSRLTQVDGPASADAIAYAYDSVGNRTKMTDQDNKVTAYAYDELNRLKNITGPDSKTTTYAYDALGNLTTLD
ncbi:MAG: RHS repeat protein, partial [Candidatus Omnitrophica bacterium]|nr:RHS repeat protein [Candidatus Omnitrophota bacterium]